MKEVYAQETLVECTDNGKSITADVDNFQPGEYLSVIMNTVKVSLQYQSLGEMYVGSMGGLEFISKGPKTVGTYR
jgi:hypothetical protein|tara:strand:- start:1075 stop:1299 length:225 start_codon:yes stop_codon:yes gene_type:complete